MPRLGTITFHLRAPEGMIPLWSRQAQIASRHVPSSDHEVTQFMGRGSWRITVEAQFTSLADFSAMQAALGNGIGYTLSEFYGETWNSVFLVAMSNERRSLTSPYYAATLEFSRT